MSSNTSVASNCTAMRELSVAEIESVGGGLWPAVLWTGAKWVGGAFGAGFVGKAGADLYDHFFGDDGC